MDISDGLSSELNHLAGASHVGIEIDCEKLPVAPEVLRMAERYGLDPLDFALNGGDQLLLPTLVAPVKAKTVFNKSNFLPVINAVII